MEDLSQWFSYCDWLFSLIKDKENEKYMYNKKGYNINLQ